MSHPRTLIARRSFLKGLNLAVGGLALGFFAADGAGRRALREAGPQAEDERSGRGDEAPGPQPQRVRPRGAGRPGDHRLPPLGDGAGHPQLAAGADRRRARARTWRGCSIVQADGDKAYGDQNTDGSNSVRGIYEDMRRAGATARTMLVAAAAKRWKVKPRRPARRATTPWCTAAAERTLGFGELAAEAGKLPVPEARGRQAAAQGASCAHVGTAAAAARRAGLRHGHRGVRRRRPAAGHAHRGDRAAARGRAAAWRGTTPRKALAVPGVKRVIELPAPKPPFAFQPWGGVAVVAENTWAAMRGARRWTSPGTHGENAVYDSETYREAAARVGARAGHAAPQAWATSRRALAKAARVVEAEYHVPHLPHVPMEPPVAVARVDGRRCEVWAPTQNPQAARTEVARVLGLAEDKVTVHVTFLGGGFGRKSKADFVAEAALLAREAGRARCACSGRARTTSSTTTTTR